jgi:hypothetical protein
MRFRLQCSYRDRHWLGKLQSTTHPLISSGDSHRLSPSLGALGAGLMLVGIGARAGERSARVRSSSRVLSERLIFQPTRTIISWRTWSAYAPENGPSRIPQSGTEVARQSQRQTPFVCELLLPMACSGQLVSDLIEHAEHAWPRKRRVRRTFPASNGVNKTIACEYSSKSNSNLCDSMFTFDDRLDTTSQGETEPMHMGTSLNHSGSRHPGPGPHADVRYWNLPDFQEEMGPILCYQIYSC